MWVQHITMFPQVQLWPQQYVANLSGHISSIILSQVLMLSKNNKLSIYLLNLEHLVNIKLFMGYLVNATTDSYW